MLFILVTDETSKFDISKLFKFLHLLNIFSIVVTFDVSKFCIIEFKFEQNSNIPSIFSTLLVSKIVKLILFNDEQLANI